MRRDAIAVVGALLILAGCPRVRDEHFTCPDGRCPSGYVCHPDAVCRRAGVGDASGADAAPADASIDGGTDAPIDAGTDAPLDAAPPAPPPVDFLFLVDTSRSMATAQEQLRTVFPDFILAMATGRLPGDPEPSFAPLTDIHVGVITPYMGTGGHMAPTCEGDLQYGHDGILRTTSVGAECPSEMPAWLTYDGTMTSTFARDFACKTSVGTNGCGFEQQLEAVAKAITPQTSRMRFYMDTTGQADRGNAGFFRDDAVLVVVLVSDEDDCSARDPDLFDPMSSTYPGDLNQRCVHYAELEERGEASPLHPVGRYADTLNDLDRPVIFAPLVGVPTVLEERPLEEILDDPSMAYGFEPPDTDEPPDTQPPRDVCDGPSGSVRASAGRRYLRVGTELSRIASDVEFVLGSICRDDYRTFAERILRAIFELAER